MSAPTGRSDNGDVANKIGTYPWLFSAKRHKIPFYVAAPLSSIDFTISSGKQIPIEERDPEEVTNVFNRCLIAPHGVKVRNIAFDVTPHKYVTAIITEKGAFRPSDIKHLMRKNADIEALRLRPRTHRKKQKQ